MSLLMVGPSGQLAVILRTAQLVGRRRKIRRGIVQTMAQVVELDTQFPEQWRGEVRVDLGGGNVGVASSSCTRCSATPACSNVVAKPCRSEWGTIFSGSPA